jgi:hypothetical protein
LVAHLLLAWGGILTSACTVLLGLRPGLPEPDGGASDVDSASDASESGELPDGADGAPSRTYPEAVRADQPSAYYRFDDGPDASVAKCDPSVCTGSKWDGKLGGVSLTTPGAMPTPANDGAVRLVNPIGAVHFGQDVTPDGNSPFTLEVWINLQKAPPNEKRYIVRRTSGMQGYDLYVEGANVSFERVRSGGVDTVSVSALPLDAYAYVVLTYDKQGTLTLWHDGVASMPTASASSIANAAELQLGSDDSSNPAADALADELAIYPVALTQAQIAAHFSAARVH